jgi:hypothetical protein
MTNRMGGVIVNVHVSGAMDRGFSNNLVKPNTMQLVFAVSTNNTQN